MLLRASRLIHETRAKKPRVMAISSGGGHWIELLRLRPAFEDSERVWVTVNEAYRTHVEGDRFLCVDDVTRWDRLGMLRCAAQVTRLLVQERPDVIISTGALPGFFGITIGKALGARTVWIDSIANVEEMSMSGDKARPFADLWLTQWKELARPGGPLFKGSVL